jgi:DNA-binding CsgD family transcriptional regulator
MRKRTAKGSKISSPKLVTTNTNLYGRMNVSLLYSVFVDSTPSFPMPSDFLIEELVKLTYEAAADATRWNDFLRLFSEAIHAPSAVFLIHDNTHQKANASVVIGVEPAWIKPYQEYFVTINPWLAAHPFRRGVVAVGEQILNDRELVRTEFYNDFLRPKDWFYCCGVLTAQDQSTTSEITAIRSRRAGSFSSNEVALFEYLAPHLQCAVRIHNRIAGLESGLNAATGALDRFPTGIVAVNSDAKVILTNRAADAIFKRGDGLMSRGGLRAVSRQETAKLRNAIAAVCMHRDSGILKPETVVQVNRPSGSKPFEVLVSPLPSNSSLKKGGAAAVLFITDPEEEAALDSRALQELFGLTPAEIRLCIALVKGKSVEEYAHEAAISSNTARTHVKRIYAKTGVRRQSELVRLLLKSSAGI